MKKRLALLAATATLTAYANNNEAAYGGPEKASVTVDDLFRYGTFRAERGRQITPLADDVHYLMLSPDYKQIIKVKHDTRKTVATVFDVATCRMDDGLEPLSAIENYTISGSETHMLIGTNVEPIYRRSYTADYYIYDIKYNALSKLSDEGGEECATISPDGTMVAYVKDNNIYIKKLRYNTTLQITDDGEINKILNGKPDWVYEEEFAMRMAMSWSPDSKELAFMRFDETEVKEYSFPVYKGSYPTYPDNALYPDTYKFKYPKAGEKNSTVGVHVYNVGNKTTKTMQVGNEKEFYVPRIVWTPNAQELAVVKLNRRQNQLDLILCNTASTVGTSIYTDKNSRYIEEISFSSFEFLPDGKRFICVSEADGFAHIYLYGTNGVKLAQLTKGQWDVTAVYGMDSKSQFIYYQAAAVSPMEREIYATRLTDRTTTKLSQRTGTNDAIFSNSCNYYINTFSSADTPPYVTTCNRTGKELNVIVDNQNLKDVMAEYSLHSKEFFTFSTSLGTTLNGWMIKPKDFDPQKQYPVVMVQYSGPGSQEVLNSWELGWEQILAERGYVVACVDPRGTGARGEEFKKCTYLQLGKYESDDQIEAAKYLGSLSYIDAKRIAIWGWSFGGFNTSLCLCKSDVFKVGIAIAPVTNWRLYDTIYTERFMRTPDDNASGYDDNSPITLAANLRGRLFLIHGTADDNVHYQNQMEFVNELIMNHKQFDMFTYPNRNHSIYGGPVRSHLYNMLLNYLKNNL